MTQTKVKLNFSRNSGLQPSKFLVSTYRKRTTQFSNLRRTKTYQNKQDRSQLMPPNRGQRNKWRYNHRCKAQGRLHRLPIKPTSHLMRSPQNSIKTK
jgi:hypothetical protein